MPNTAPNPYDWNYHYRFVSARLMFQYGGSVPWGQFVRGSLVEFHQLGIAPSTAHNIAYSVADQRVSFTEMLSGRSTAVMAAAWLLGFEHWSMPKMARYPFTFHMKR